MKAGYYIPRPECPKAKEHTPCPSGYHAFDQWAFRKMRKYYQAQCAGCNHWVIWRKKAIK